MTRRIGIVVIGRNEGERLLRCLASVVGDGRRVVYVDSGSGDGSVASARARGVEVVELDTTVPFTAARARNSGVERLLTLDPRLEFVQFVDGDCEVDAAWIDRGVAALAQQPDVAVVCGRRRERFPDATTWNRLCDMEWDTPIGDATACGGDSLMRLHVFRSVGGFDPTLIAGEEPELCVRIRRAGHRIVRLDLPMTLHDAAMTRFRQWWTRNVRAGHAAIDVLVRHPNDYEYGRRSVRSAVVYAAAVPSVALVTAVNGLLFAQPVIVAAAACAPLVYVALALRIAVRRRRAGETFGMRLRYGVACVVAKWAELRGITKYARDRRARRVATLIEYK